MLYEESAFDPKRTSGHGQCDEAAGGKRKLGGDAAVAYAIERAGLIFTALRDS